MPTTITGENGINKVAPGTIEVSDLTTPWPGFNQYFESSPQTYTIAGSVVLAHGFGVVPKLVSLELLCITGDLNYSPGDIVPVSMHGSGDGGTGSSNSGIGLWKDATNVGVRFGSAAMWITNKTTGASSLLTSARWNLIVRAWA